MTNIIESISYNEEELINIQNDLDSLIDRDVILIRWIKRRSCIHDECAIPLMGRIIDNLKEEGSVEKFCNRITNKKLIL